MKKLYMMPLIEVTEIESEAILAASSVADTVLDDSNVIDNVNDIEARPFEGVWNNDDKSED